MREAPGSDAWVREWELIRAGNHQGKTKRGVAKDSLEHLIQLYRKSPEYAQLRASTRKVRGRMLSKIISASGDMPYRNITSANIRAGRDARADTPSAANNHLKLLSALFAWAVERELVDANPVHGVKRLKERAGGHKAWTVEDCLAFEAAHPSGSAARLAYALALYTASRRSDVVTLGPRNLTRDGFLRIRQQKTERVIVVPVVTPLAKELAQTPTAFTFLTTQSGTPWKPESLTNAFRTWTAEAGLKRLSVHGLRKAMATRLAEHGMTAKQIAAVTGHVTLSEVQRYTAEADQKRLAAEAMKSLFDEQNVSLLTAHLSPSGQKGEKAQ
ncbi:MAG: tyrosine-type recombinase/integrase [Pseudomonadota bacterium]